MKFVCFDHTGKSVYLRQQFLAAGHEETTNADELDLLLVDCDWPWAHPRPALIEAAHDRGAVVVQYPHGGMLTAFVYDGLCEPDERVAVRLEHGQGSIDTLADIRDDLKQQAAGWLFCPTTPFKPGDRPKRILFGPRHPNIEVMVNRQGNGHDPGPAINQQVFRRLLELPDVQIAVSIVGPAWKSGVWAHPKARFAPNPNMWFPHTFEQILSCDLVVATGTMAAAAVALGKPTVMFDQGDCSDFIDGQYTEATHADEYRHLMRYPADIDDGHLPDLIDDVCNGTRALRAWRDLWIGQDGTDQAVATIERLVAAARPDADSQSVTVAGATARSTTGA